jgi:hypothetical protein
LTRIGAYPIELMHEVDSQMGRSTVFLSSNEAQDVVNSLWMGDLVTNRKGHQGQDCKWPFSTL